MYVLGDERDLIGLRTNFRLNDVYLYRDASHAGAGAQTVRRRDGSREQAERRAGVLQHAHEQLHDEHRRAREHTRARPHPYDYRVLLPGYSDRLAYDPVC